jgi:hypothetical protein
MNIKIKYVIDSTFIGYYLGKLYMILFNWLLINFLLLFNGLFPKIMVNFVNMDPFYFMSITFYFTIK